MALTCLASFRQSPTEALGALDELMAQQLAFALDAVTDDVADVDAAVDRLEQCRATLDGLACDANVNVVLIGQRDHQEYSELAELAIAQEVALCASQQNVRETVREVGDSLADIGDRIRVARDTVRNIASLQLDQMPSPVGYDLTTLLDKERAAKERFASVQSQDAAISSSITAVQRLRALLAVGYDAAQLGQMADLIGKMGHLPSAGDESCGPLPKSMSDDTRRMLTLVNGLAADRILLAKLDVFLAKVTGAAQAVQLRIVELVSRHWR